MSNETHGYDDDFPPESWSSAQPGERVSAFSGDMTATATNDYRVMHGELFRRFSWCSDSIANAPAYSPKGEWFAVIGHWKQFKKKAAA